MRDILHVRAPSPLVAAVNRAADEAEQSPSALIREAVANELARRGHWPPRRDEVSDGR